MTGSGIFFYPSLATCNAEAMRATAKRLTVNNPGCNPG